jgi:hypothetical protein
MAREPEDAGRAGLWVKSEREAKGWSADELARRINGLAMEEGDPTRVRVISKKDDLYKPWERLVEEINLIGKVVWFGRRVQ